jgi:hypothetical protein
MCGWISREPVRRLGDKKLRQRSGAFPFELAYRLISMFSVMGDTVLDPFMGTGTSMFAAVAAGRNSHGYELDRSLASLIQGGCRQVIDLSRQRIAARFDAHRQFVREREQSGKAIKYRSRVYGFPVITRQEIEMAIAVPTEIVNTGDTQWQVRYDVPSASGDGRTTVPSTGAQSSRSSGQLPLFEEP